MIKSLLFFFSGALASLLVGEAVLRLLPVSTSTRTGYYLTPDILTYPPHHRWTSSSGWDLRNAQSMSSNNYGFAADRDFVTGSDAVVLVGDSYVEASMLPPEERPAALLEHALAGPMVYAMGGPGSSLLDYAERIRWATDVLKLRRFVVLLENSDASQSLCNSGNVHARCLAPESLEPSVVHQPSTGALKSILRESSLAQYLASQLKLSASLLKSSRFWAPGVSEASMAVDGPKVAASQAPPLSESRRVVVDAAISAFFSRLQEYDDLQIVFVIDMNRDNLDTKVLVEDEGKYTAERMLSLGQIVIRGEPLYREHLRTSKLSLSVSPLDRHLNRIGLRLLMNAAAHQLIEHSFKTKGN